MRRMSKPIWKCPASKKTTWDLMKAPLYIDVLERRQDGVVPTNYETFSQLFHGVCTWPTNSWCMWSYVRENVLKHHGSLQHAEMCLQCLNWTTPMSKKFYGYPQRCNTNKMSNWGLDPSSKFNYEGTSWHFVARHLRCMSVCHAVIIVILM